MKTGGRQEGLAGSEAGRMIVGVVEVKLVCGSSIFPISTPVGNDVNMGRMDDSFRAGAGIPGKGRIRLGDGEGTDDPMPVPSPSPIPAPGAS